MRQFMKYLKANIFRGFLAIIPLGLSFLVIRFIYLAVDTRITRIVEKFIGFRIPGLGILLVLILLYLLGLAVSNWAGRRALALIDKITARIPLIKTIYTLGKQLAEALSLPEKQAFKKAVLVEQFRTGLWSIGFVTGTVVDKRNVGEPMVKVFIPTAPNPTTGFMIMLKESQVRDLDWSVPEAMNAIISGGIAGPDEI